MLRTRFTELVGCQVPIQQAGMGPLASTALAQAVTAAGAVGSVSVTDIPVDLAASFLDDARARIGGPFSVNIVHRFVDPGRLAELVALAAQRAAIVDFFYDEPEANLVRLAHEQGALVSWQVGSREEAEQAVDAGCDIVIAQGVAAGGHVRGTIGLLALLDEVLQAVHVPVLAAGGIGSGRALAAVLAAGADGARVGTRFVAAAETPAHPRYVAALIEARPHDTVCANVFDRGWPGAPAPHRVLRSCIEAAQAHAGPVVGEATDLYTGEPFVVERFAVSAVRDAFRGDIDAMSLWAGESVAAVTRVLPAGTIVREMADEAEQRLRLATSRVN